MFHGPLIVREKISVFRGEIWTLFAIFMFIIILLHYILIRQVHFILIKWNFYDH
jgi:hypothetical protein